jgi:hypothetical protein
MDSTAPSKDTVWQTGLKRKIQQSVVYKRPILLIEINTGLGERLEKDLPNNGPSKQVGVAIIISDQVDFKLTLVKQDKEGHFVLIKGGQCIKRK